MTKSNKLKFEIDRLLFKRVLDIVVIVFTVALLAWLIVQILFPFALGIMKWFLYLWALYSSITDINWRFLGAIFFLYVGIKIFEALIFATIKIVETLIDYVRKIK